MSNDDRAAAHFGVLQLLEAYRQTAIVVAAVESGVLDMLDSSEKYVDEVIELSKFDYDHGVRFLQALKALRFIKIEEGMCELDEMGRALVSSPFYLKEKALLVGREYIGAWFSLPKALKSGASGFQEDRGGETIWEHRGENPELGRAFDRVMGLNSKWVIAALESFDFSEYERVLDIGGGNGAILRELLVRYPRLKGTVFDTIAIREDVIVNDRLQMFMGDFFDGSHLATVGKGADLIMLCNVLHDWKDQDAKEILRACRQSGIDKLLIVEHFADENLQPVDALRDLHMMAVTGGKQRTIAEIEELLGAVDLRGTRRAKAWVLAVPNDR